MKYAERQGVQTKNIHKMRKTYAGNLATSGVPLDARSRNTKIAETRINRAPAPMRRKTLTLKKRETVHEVWGTFA